MTDALVGVLVSIVSATAALFAVHYSKRSAIAAEEALRIERTRTAGDAVRFAELFLPLLQKIDAVQRRARDTPESVMFQPTTLVDSYEFTKMNEAAKPLALTSRLLDLRTELNTVCSTWSRSLETTAERQAYADALAPASRKARAILGLGPDEPVPPAAELTRRIEAQPASLGGAR